jgi:hypothetical protein
MTMHRYLVAMLLLALTPGLSAQQSGYVSMTPYFSGEVKNLKRTSTNKVFVSIFLTNRTQHDFALGRVRDTSCAKSATLLDAKGNEYLALSCLPDTTHGGTPIGLPGRSATNFVLEFSSPVPIADAANLKYSLVVPISSWHPGQGFFTTTLSFFDLDEK